MIWDLVLGLVDLKTIKQKSWVKFPRSADPFHDTFSVEVPRLGEGPKGLPNSDQE